MIHRLAIHAMGTRFELVLIGEDEALLRAAGEEAAAEIDECERRLSRFRKDSLLSHVNRCAGRDWVDIDGETFDLLSRCGELNRVTGGAFDPTIAPLMDAQGIGPGGSGDPARACGPVGWEQIELDPDRGAIRFRKVGVALDLGAVGKGYGLDQAVERLREAGVEAALLHGGTSTAVAIGSPEDAGCGEPSAWCVAVGPGARAPRALLSDCALSVSAQWGRRGQGLSAHVLDPRSGTAPSGPSLAAVIADDACTADAWSTALLVDPRARCADLQALTAEGSGAALRWSGPVPTGGRFSFSEVLPMPGQTAPTRTGTS